MFAATCSSPPIWLQNPMAVISQRIYVVHPGTDHLLHLQWQYLYQDSLLLASRRTSEGFLNSPLSAVLLILILRSGIILVNIRYTGISLVCLTGLLLRPFGVGSGTKLVLPESKNQSFNFGFSFLRLIQGTRQFSDGGFKTAYSFLQKTRLL